jgi:hypothetical protein
MKKILFFMVCFLLASCTGKKENEIKADSLILSFLDKYLKGVVN